MGLKAMVKSTPFLGVAALAAWKLFTSRKKFEGSGAYWERRYRSAGNSGAGSYSRLAEFKAEILNEFVREHSVRSVIEFGSGDGNQLRLANYPEYFGIDVSPAAVHMCRGMFDHDPSKSFATTAQYAGEKADLAMSLDVIYHLVEDEVYERYMQQLFEAATRYVVIYASNDEQLNRSQWGAHVRHRAFTKWVDENAAEWTLLRSLPNKYPYDPANPNQTSFADFYFYERKDQSSNRLA